MSGKLTWAVGDYTLSSLSAYRMTRPRNFNDLDVTTANAITQFRSEDDEQLSEELQIVSPAGRDFEWLLGAYYFDETNDVRNQYVFPFVDECSACRPIRLLPAAAGRAGQTRRRALRRGEL